MSPSFPSKNNVKVVLYDHVGIKINMLMLYIKTFLQPKSVFLSSDFKRNLYIPKGSYGVGGLGTKPPRCISPGPCVWSGAQGPHGLGSEVEENGLWPLEDGSQTRILGKWESKAHGDKPRT